MSDAGKRLIKAATEAAAATIDRLTKERDEAQVWAGKKGVERDEAEAKCRAFIAALEDAETQVKDLRGERDEARAALRWQPIETAPKDGTPIITCVAGFEPMVGCRWVEFEDGARFSVDPETFIEEEHFQAYFHGCEYEPTHWMPLPAAPANG